MNKKKLLEEVLKDIEAAEEYYKDQIIPLTKEIMQIYEADAAYYNEMFSNLTPESQFTIKDVASTIEAVMPDIMKIIYGNDKVISVNPIGREDVDNARKVQKLINVEIKKLNPGYKLFSRWCKAALTRPISVLKCTWEKRKKKVADVVVIDESNPQDMTALEGVEVLGRAEEAGGLTRLEVAVEKIVKDQPVLEYLMPDEFIFLPDSLDINNVSFAAHRMPVTDSELRRSTIYNQSDVEKAIREAPDDPDWDSATYSTSDSALKKSGQKNPFYDNYFKYRGSKAKGRKVIILHECYGKYDLDGDGIAEDIIVTVANKKTILRVDENEYGRPPFFVLYPLIEPDTPVPKTITELAAIFQHIKIALMRQVIINTAKSNTPRIFYDEDSGIGPWLEQNYQYIPVRLGISQNIHNLVKQEEIMPLAPWTFDLLQRNENDKEMVTGVTRYYQGTDAKALNKTAHGISLITSMAQRRVEMIARNLIETGFKELFKFLVELNDKFVENETVVRVLGEPIDFANFSERFDVEVDVGIGFGVKQQEDQALAIVGNFYPAFVNNLQVFMQFPNFYDKFRNYYARVLVTNNIKDVDTYLPTVEEVKMMGQMIAQQAQPPQAQPAGPPEAQLRALAG